MGKNQNQNHGYTISLASGTQVTPLTLLAADGSELKFQIRAPNDKIKSLRLQKLKSLNTDDELIDYIAELLHKAADEGVTHEQIKSAFTDPETTDSARAQIMDVAINGRITDPKTFGLLLDKLAAAMMENLVQAI